MWVYSGKKLEDLLWGGCEMQQLNGFWVFWEVLAFRWREDGLCQKAVAVASLVPTETVIT